MKLKIDMKFENEKNTFAKKKLTTNLFLVCEYIRKIFFVLFMSTHLLLIRIRIRKNLFILTI